MRPEELLYVHRALVTAREELELAVRLLPKEEVVQAAAFVQRSDGGGGSRLGSASPLPSADAGGGGSSGGGSGGARAASLVARDAAIATAIGKLPERTGTALTCSSLQQELDNAWRETNLAREPNGGSRPGYSESEWALLCKERTAVEGVKPLECGPPGQTRATTYRLQQ